MVVFPTPFYPSGHAQVAVKLLLGPAANAVAAVNQALSLSNPILANLQEVSADLLYTPSLFPFVAALHESL